GAARDRGAGADEAGPGPAIGPAPSVAQAFRPPTAAGSPEGLRDETARAALKGCATRRGGEPRRAARRDGARARSVQRHLLGAPVPDLADPEGIFGAAIERVHHAELFRHLAGAAELADDLAGEPHLVDLAVLHALGLVRVGRVEVLRRAARYANRLRCADVGDLRLERPFP